jgi:hypothetical protein
MALVQVRTPAGEGSRPAVTAAAAETSGTTPRIQVVVTSFVAIIVFWLLSITINANFKPSVMVIPAGISLFAMLYAVTQGLERLLEPVSSFFLSTKQHAENRDATLAAAVNLQAASEEELTTKLSELVKAARATEQLRAAEPARRTASGLLRRNQATEGVTAARGRVAEAILPALEGNGHHRDRVVERLADLLHVPENEAPAVTKKVAVDLAAAAQAELDQRRADKMVAYWALASILGLLLSATLGLYLLHIVGLRGDGLAEDGTWTGGAMTPSGIRHMLDILVTGLAIGGGTKPLHDLISNLQASKDSKQDPSQAR